MVKAANLQMDNGIVSRDKPMSPRVKAIVQPSLWTTPRHGMSVDIDTAVSIDDDRASANDAAGAQEMFMTQHGMPGMRSLKRTHDQSNRRSVRYSNTDVTWLPTPTT